MRWWSVAGVSALAMPATLTAVLSSPVLARFQCPQLFRFNFHHEGLVIVVNQISGTMTRYHCRLHSSSMASAHLVA